MSQSLETNVSSPHRSYRTLSKWMHPNEGVDTTPLGRIAQCATSPMERGQPAASRRLAGEGAWRFLQGREQLQHSMTLGEGASTREASLYDRCTASVVRNQESDCIALGLFGDSATRLLHGSRPPQPDFCSLHAGEARPLAWLSLRNRRPSGGWPVASDSCPTAGGVSRRNKP